MKRIGRLLSVYLVAAVLLSMACVTASAEAPLKSWQKDTSPITLDIFVNASWWDRMWTTETSERITAATGVTLNIIKPVADDNQKLILMINSGDFPDMIVTDVGNDVNQLLVDSGMVWDLDELVDTYAPEIRKNADPAVFTDFKMPDGHTYYYTNFTDSEQYRQVSAQNNKLVTSNQPSISIRKDYYEEIGSPNITTPEEFFDALSRMHALHPEKIAYYQSDGKMSSSLSTSLGDLGTYFGISGYAVNDRNEIELWPRTQKFYDTVMFYNKMSRSGLLTRDSFIDESAVSKTKVLNGDVISYGWTLYDGTYAPADNPNTNYFILPPFDTYRTIRAGGGWMTTFFTKNKNAARAINLANFLIDPVDGLIQFGILAKEGETYSGDPSKGPHIFLDEQGWPRFFPEYMNGLNDTSIDWNKTGSSYYFFFNSSALANIVWWELGPDPDYDYYNEIFGSYVLYRPEFNNRIMKPDGESEEGIILAKYASVFNSYLVDIIFAETEDAAKAAYDVMIKGIDSIGAAKLEAYYMTQYRNFLGL